MPVRKFQRMKTQHFDDSLALKPNPQKFPLQDLDDFGSFGRLSAIALLDGIDNLGGDDGE
jgi:hypothetical protein